MCLNIKQEARAQDGWKPSHNQAKKRGGVCGPLRASPHRHPRLLRPSLWAHGISQFDLWPEWYLLRLKAPRGEEPDSGFPSAFSWLLKFSEPLPEELCLPGELLFAGANSDGDCEGEEHELWEEGLWSGSLLTPGRAGNDVTVPTWKCTVARRGHLLACHWPTLCHPHKEKIEFCVAYHANGQVFWDNNEGQNYRIVHAQWKPDGCRHRWQFLQDCAFHQAPPAKAELEVNSLSWQSKAGQWALPRMAELGEDGELGPLPMNEATWWPVLTFIPHVILGLCCSILGRRCYFPSVGLG